jgi:hypothetical protein
VRERANRCCEYCLLSEDDAFFAHEPDHIIARKHDGKTELDNLCWSCFDCNRFKGSNIASIDSISEQLTPLFNPRKQFWDEHFEIQGGQIVPLTEIGRATEKVLKLNLMSRVEVRAMLSRLERYPTQKA